MILPLTADYTGGYCMPCANSRTFVSDPAEAGRTPPAASLCNRCGAALRTLREIFGGFCESCAKVRQAGDDSPPNRIENQFCELGQFEPEAVRRLAQLLERAGITFRTAPVLMRIPHRGGPVTKTLVSIIIRFEDRSQAQALVYPDRLPANAIRNCTVGLKYVCPLDWDQLGSTPETGTRFCKQCEKKVFLCSNDFEAINHARQGHCIAMPGEDGTAKHLLKMGMPPPLTDEQKARYVAYCVDQAKTNALRQISDISDFCSVCGYPLDRDTSECIVCRAKRHASVVYR
jgi:hypothetical protein